MSAAPKQYPLNRLAYDAGWFFHIAEVRGRPRFMRVHGYRRYLKENDKRELHRTRLAIPRPSAAHAKLEELLAKQWTWFVLPNNCASFVEDVVQAGGSNAGLYFNCPALENFG